MPLSLHRSFLQQRFTGTQTNKLSGPRDNAFNRERLAVKAHAAQSAGMLQAKATTNII